MSPSTTQLWLIVSSSDRMPLRTPWPASLVPNEATQASIRTIPGVCRRSPRLVSITIQWISQSLEGHYTIHLSVYKRNLATNSRSPKWLSKRWASAPRFPSYAPNSIPLTSQRLGMELYRLDLGHLELTLPPQVRGAKTSLASLRRPSVRSATGTITSNQSALIIPRCIPACVFPSNKSETTKFVTE